MPTVSTIRDRAAAGLLLRPWLADMLAVTGLVVVSIVVTVWWMHPEVNSFTLQTHGDQAWMQASAQVGMQSGPFATNIHTGWSSGFDPWAYPTGGAIGFFAMAWLFGVVEDSSSNVLVGIMAVTAATIATATYAAVRLGAARPVHRYVAWLAALAMGISPYVLSKTGHYLVAAFYLVPVVIAVIGVLRVRRSRRMTGWLLALVAATALVSTLWWTLIVAYLLAFGLLIALLLRSWSWARLTGMVLGAVGIGAALPIGLSLTHAVSEATWNRQPWDSRGLSGSLTDFILASPFLRSLWPGLDQVLPATSAELSTVGLLPALAALAALAMALTAYLRFSEDDRKSVGWLLVALQVTLLTFLTLGLGTMTEAVLSLVGVESPLRAWSRLSIIVALLGLMLVAPWLSDRVASLSGRTRPVVLTLVAVVAVAFMLADVRSIVTMTPRTLPDIPEVPAVAYLTETVGDCPVAQLPVGSFPDFPMADGTELSITYYYRGFVPYLLNPEGRWSFGAALGTASDTLLRDLPATVETQDLLGLRAAGYCAVLYDNEYADWVRGRGLGWPGEATRGLVPDWSGDRFDVYLLQP